MDWQNAPERPVEFAPLNLEVRRREEDGVIFMRNLNPSGDPPASVPAPLREQAQAIGERVWLAQRPRGEPLRPGVWNTMTFAQAREEVETLAGALADLGIGAGDTLMAIAQNGIEHAMMSYATNLVGAAFAPVSPAYATMSDDFAKLRHVAGLVKPVALFVDNAALYAKALEVLSLKGPVIGLNKDEGVSLSYAELLARGHRTNADAMYAALTGAMPAKYLFTSGSTGLPKAVELTHRMMSVNAVALRRISPEPEDEKQVILNWLPWNHVYGANAVLNVSLVAGVTFYIDEGRPLPGAFDTTLANLREIAPTTFQNVPAAFNLLAPALEADPELAKTFFSRLRFAAYGGAAISRDVWERFQKVAVRTTGKRVMFASGYGATETSPTCLTVHWSGAQQGILGLPVPSVELKLVPTATAGRYDMRIKGESVVKRYRGNAERTKEAFDEEGYYQLGDAVSFLDPAKPEEGLRFEGRLAENFKLATGVWVNVGILRLEILKACDGLVADAVITGINEDGVGMLAFPNLAAARAVAGDDALAYADIAQHRAVLAALADRLAGHNATHPGSSTRIARAALLSSPPDISHSEITDKGYLNQAACLISRAAEVARLYGALPADGIVEVARAKAKAG